jgi:hypothetical protein
VYGSLTVHTCVIVCVHLVHECVREYACMCDVPVGTHAAPWGQGNGQAVLHTQVCSLVPGGLSPLCWPWPEVHIPEKVQTPGQ